MLKVKRALISVSNKEGLIPFAKDLRKSGVEIISTGGTLKALKKAKVKAVAISDFTGFPEMLEGRVKTLHPKIHGGILFRRGVKKHKKEAKEYGIEPIDMVVVNLYPFGEVIKDPKTDFAEAVENIDIGGPTMLRAAAKNYVSVAAVCDPADYPWVIQEIERTGGISKRALASLSRKVFRHTAEYDAAISGYLADRAREEKGKALPENIEFSFGKAKELRYGENPHQKAAIYNDKAKGSVLKIKQLHGKELSYNNMLDIEAAVSIVDEFEEPAVSVVKHNNPCGISENDDLALAARNAIDSDPLSAFGGILGINRSVTGKTAKVILDRLPFFEVICAPVFSKKALKLLKERKNLRILKVEWNFEPKHDYKITSLGLLAQDIDCSLRNEIGKLKKNLVCKTNKKPTAEEIEELLFAWRCAKVVKSNGIVLTKDKKTIGIGAGQMSRVDAVKIACEKAGGKSDGACLASDGFFPMRDSIDVAARHGIRIIIQPGGSIRDQEVIDACDDYQIPMVFTGQRHFRH